MIWIRNIFSFCHEYSVNVCVARTKNCPYYVLFISVDILCMATRFRIPSGVREIDFSPAFPSALSINPKE